MAALTYDDCEPLARPVIESLDGLSEVELELLALALKLAGGPLAVLGRAFEGRNELSVLQLARALRLASITGGWRELFERLEGVDVSPWAELRYALEQVLEIEVT